jgi:pimeloyl-ACP methyl ester carboxylesterase
MPSPPDVRQAAGVAFDRTGSGPPIVLVHGLGGDRGIWRPVAAAVAAERDVIAVDVPGFGASAPLSNGHPPDPAALAAALARMLDALGLQRVAVAGNSLGAWIALELAALGRAESVVCIAPAGLWRAPLGPKPYPMYRAGRALGRGLALVLRFEKARHLALAASVAHPERVPEQDAIRMALSYAAAPGFIAVSNAMRAGRFTASDRIDVPVTIAWCEHDRLIVRPRRLPFEATEVVLADCGHVPMWDAPDAIARLLLGVRT